MVFEKSCFEIDQFPNRFSQKYDTFNSKSFKFLVFNLLLCFVDSTMNVLKENIRLLRYLGICSASDIGGVQAWGSNARQPFIMKVADVRLFWYFLALICLIVPQVILYSIMANKFRHNTLP